MEIIKKEFNFQPYGNIPEGARLNLGCGRAQYTNLINIDNNTNNKIKNDIKSDVRICLIENNGNFSYCSDYNPQHN